MEELQDDNFFVFLGACLVTSGLLLHICVAAMLIWKPPANSISEAGSAERAKPNNSIKYSSKTEGVRVLSTTTKVKENIDSKNKKYVGNVPGFQEIKEEVQGLGDKPSVSPIVPSHVITDALAKKNFEDSIKFHTVTVLRKGHFLLLLVNTVLFYFGTSVMFTHLTAFAESQGKSTSFGNLMLSVLGGASILGRVILNALCQQKWVNSIALYIIAVSLCGKLFFKFQVSQEDLVLLQYG